MRHRGTGDNVRPVLESLQHFLRTNRTTRQSAQRWLRCEALEDRCLLAIDLTSFEWQSNALPSSLEERSPDRIEDIGFDAKRLYYGDQTIEMVWEPLEHSALEDHDHNDSLQPIASPRDSSLAAIPGLPLLHSLPGAAAKVFLDFDSNFEPSWGGNSNVYTPPYDIDGDPDSFSDQELRNIREIWQRVAEDYAPFNIDVTTEDPTDSKTVLRQAISADDNRIRTYYFRHAFEVDNASQVSQLTVQLLRDDGAAVYLNGQEVVRDNLPANAGFDTLANGTASGSAESRFFPFSISPDLILDGTNVLAVEVHQASDTSSDVGFDLRMVGTVAGQANSELVAAESEWRYLDDGSNQGTAWREADFIDANWPLGESKFGYGDAPGTVHVAIGGSSNDWFGGGAGGVAFVGTFGMSRREVVYVFAESVGNSTQSIAEASSHEAGHAFGLAHQSLFDSDTGEELEDYHPGEGNWAPIMGVSYGKALSTWHLGPTNSVNSRQDDMRIIGSSGNGFGFRDDDFGNTSNSAAELVDAVHRIQVDGVIEGNNDVDAFTFELDPSQSGISVRLDVAEVGNNLDAVLELQDATGQTIISDAPSTSFGAKLETALSPGRYTLLVKPESEYGRVGQYRLTGSVDAPTQTEVEFGSSVIPGSLAYHSGPLLGAINYPNDTDDFRLPIAAGQFVAAVLTPLDAAASLQIEMVETGQKVAAVRAGQAIRLPSFRTDGAPLTLRISGDRATDYQLQLALNSEIEFPGTTDQHSLVIDAAFADGLSDKRTVVGSANGPFDAAETLVSSGAAWKYSDAGTNLGTGWRSTNYDDSNWNVGVGQFGYGDGDEQTLLNELDGRGNRIRTFYFRHEFEILDLEQLKTLALHLLVDDGAAVYLNGREVRRDNLAANATYNTLADETANEREFFLSAVDPALLQNGRNVLAVEVHQTSDTSSDVSFQLMLTANDQPTDEDVTDVIADTSRWSYWANADAPDTAWTSVSIDDQAWNTGVAEFGYGDNDERTVLPTSDANQRIRTFYFRQTFDANQLGLVADLLGRIKFDDGAAVYLNGTEVFRQNLAADAGHRDFALGNRSNEDAFEDFEIPLNLIRPGNNVIAAEVHQTSDTSSDVSFQLGLRAIAQLPEIDSYTFTVVAEQVNLPLDIFLTGSQDASFAASLLEVLDANDNVLAVGQASADAEIDLAVLNWVPRLAGPYRIRFSTERQGDYALMVLPSGQSEHAIADEVTELSLAPNVLLLGAVSAEHPSDTYLLPATANQPVTLTLETDGQWTGLSSELAVQLVVSDSSGNLLAVSSGDDLQQTLRFTPTATQAYQVEVVRQAGRGDYVLQWTDSTETNGDLNQDGMVNAADIDLLAAAIRNESNRFDLNDDGVTNEVDRLFLLQQILVTSFGDANLDGRFDSTDLVMVFTAGEYEDALLLNSTWSTGDWNGDGEFGTSDLVAAFQAGGYQAN